MPNLIRINTFSNKFSQNLLPAKSTFTDVVSPVVFNITSGSAAFSTGDPYRLDYSFYLINTLFDTTDLVFNLGDALNTQISQAGNYLFQMAIRDDVSGPNSFLPFDFEILVYKNSVHTETLTGSFNENPTDYNGKWAVFAQQIYVPASTVIDFAFKIKHNPSSPTAAQNCQIGMIKLEIDNKFINATTPYSLPIGYFKNPTTGWAYYVDSLATPTITIGTSYTQISIDALGATIDDHLPLEIRGASQLWAGSKITPISVGDDYDGRFDITITAKTGSPTAIELIIDISGGAAGTNKAFTGWLQAIGTAPYDQSMPLDFFALATFKANGGKIYARTDTGTVTIGRRNIKISRKSKSF